MERIIHPDLYDVCIVGGGINGAGIARDAAGRGLKVLLVEQGDLAQATSSSSSKLIHGGLRYLEYYEFKLVRESLRERDVLLKLAPHIVSPLTFILPLMNAIRPYWMIRAGLFLYDHLGGRKALPSCRGIAFDESTYGAPLQPHIKKGFSYADCTVDDARLVVLNAMSARDKGAVILTRTECRQLAARDGVWTVGLRHGLTGESFQIRSRAIVNAAGPWVRSVLNDNDLSDDHTPSIRLVQGSHIVVPRLYEGSHAYTLQQPDARVVFAIPYEEKFTLIGTTETDYQGDPLKAGITAQEIDYLLAAVNRSFKKELKTSDVVWTYSGVRPLFDDRNRDPKAVTRDYRFHEAQHNGAWMLSVFGGKLTTYRRLSEQAVARLMNIFSMISSPWTAAEPLPGGEFTGGFKNFLEQKRLQWPKVEPWLLERYARSYGTHMDDILLADPGRDFGEGVCEAELRYLIEREFALTADDVLWRRSKLGLHVSAATMQAIRQAMPVLVREMMGYDTDDASGD